MPYLDETTPDGLPAGTGTGSDVFPGGNDEADSRDDGEDVVDGTDAVRDTDDLDVSGGVTDDPGVEEVGGHPEEEDEPALDASPF